jgi:hypothetical protein
MSHITSEYRKHYGSNYKYNFHFFMEIQHAVVNLNVHLIIYIR